VAVCTRGTTESPHQTANAAVPEAPSGGHNRESSGVSSLEAIVTSSVAGTSAITSV
jgi:hypothetical protein